MAKRAKITRKALVQLLDRYLFGWAYKDIERASIQGSAKLAGFILGACFIDAMASFYGGVDRESAKKGAGKRFTDFVKKYMPQYDAKLLWQDLRCGLVHSYAEGGTYVFTDGNKAGSHFDKTPGGRIMLNLENFCADLQRAYSLFRSDVLTNKGVFENAKVRFESMGIMMGIPVGKI